MDFAWTSDLPTYYYEPTSEGGYEGIKFVTVVDGAAAGPVSLSIAERDRDSAGLVDDPERWNAPSLMETDHTVRFEVCPGRDAAFNGGFIVTEPICLHVSVADVGVSGFDPVVVWTAAIPFGVPQATCTSEP